MPERDARGPAREQQDDVRGEDPLRLDPTGEEEGCEDGSLREERHAAGDVYERRFERKPTRANDPNHLACEGCDAHQDDERSRRSHRVPRRGNPE